MKIKEGLILREVAGEYVVVSVKPGLNFDGMLTLNDTARSLWQVLEKGADEEALVQGLLAEYEVDEPMARKAVVSFIAKLSEMNFLA
jgi:hypothetical protein